MSRVVHFEIPVDNPDRAVQFYSTVFNWQIDKWAGPIEYWFITTGEETEPGINGAITKREGFQTTIINTIEVSSIDDFLDKVTMNGGKIINPKTPVPGIGYAANFEDTEGNVFGLMQPDTSAE